MINVKEKAEIAYCTGDVVVPKELAESVLKELENYNGVFYGDLETNGLVLIERSK